MFQAEVLGKKPGQRKIIGPPLLTSEMIGRRLPNGCFQVEEYYGEFIGTDEERQQWLRGKANGGLRLVDFNHRNLDGKIETKLIRECPERALFPPIGPDPD